MSLVLLFPSSLGAATAFPAGVDAVWAVGTGLATGKAQTAVSGVTAASSIGTATGTGKAQTVVSGVELVSAIGTAIATGGGGSVAATAFPDGVSLAASVGEALATGAALSEVSGLELVASIGQATADGGSVIPVPVPDVPVVVGGGGQIGGSFTPQRLRTVTRVRTKAATAHPRIHWKPLISRVGDVVVTGAATAQPLGVSVTSAVGTVAAHGHQNLTDAQWAILLLEAA